MRALTETKIDFSKLTTPALVFDQAALIETVSVFGLRPEFSNVRILYSLKASAEFGLLECVMPFVQGVSCSSAFEANLLNASGSTKQIQIVSPGLSKRFLDSLMRVPELLTFNSIPQFDRLCGFTSPETRLAIRVNPKTQFVTNEKYDPCRHGSKLGVTVEKIAREFETNNLFRDRITGIHVHNNCESDDFEQLRQTVEMLKPLLNSEFDISWVNLGGGYEIAGVDFAPFGEIVNELANEYGLEVFFEPGGGLVRESGYLVSTVVDIFDSDEESIAILDTAVNHAPEVFEYNWSPPVLAAVEGGKHQYTLAGCSCLAGDIFGRYGFDKPLSVGEKVVFSSLGAYAMPKWSYFNGINLPNVYLLTSDGELVLKKSFTFEDFANRCGGSIVVAD